MRSAWLCAWTALPLMAAELTHGPLLGRPGAETMSVWGRSSRPAELRVRYRAEGAGEERRSAAVRTVVEHDLCAHVALTDLAPDTTYEYQLLVDGEPAGEADRFRTWPDQEALRDEKLNPRGLFNFSFEFACGNNQNPNGGLGPSLPTYDTLNRQVRDEVLFAILNGDWLYEEARDYAPDAWARQVGLTGEPPEQVRLTPNIAGVWENYKTYLGRAPNLAAWHRRVPSFYTFDDHELVNDGFGFGSAGYRNRRALFRDIAVRGWYDYLGWSNPLATRQGIQFGLCELEAGSDVLVDRGADFTKVDWAQAASLHVHWGTPEAGMMDIEDPPDGIDDPDVEGGDPNARVYEVLEVLGPHKLRIRPTPEAGTRSRYSIGRHSYGSFRVGNCEFHLCDTRTHRELHDIKRPDKPGLSMLGRAQRDWLLGNMRASDADFHFVVSSVNFMIPHVGGGGHHFDAATKDDAWTVFLEERELLINAWDELGKPVFVLTGDLHNSFAIRITDRVWEFASGPHNSVNHRAQDEGGRPVNGPFKYGPRACDIRWSTTALPDIERPNRMFPHFCVVQVNNVFNNPLERGGTRRVAFPLPHVVFRYHDVLSGKLAYAETIRLEP